VSLDFNMKKYILSMAIGVLCVAMIFLVEEKRGYIVEVYKSGWVSEIVYTEEYKGTARQARLLIVPFEDKREGANYFCGYYNKLIGAYLWLSKCESGMTDDLLYYSERFSLKNITKDSSYLGIKSYAGTVPGVEPSDGCDDDHFIGAEDVYWLDGTGDIIFSQEQLSAIEKVKKNAHEYNQSLHAIKCKDQWGQSD